MEINPAGSQVFVFGHSDIHPHGGNILARTPEALLAHRIYTALVYRI